jgi:hypothetical protein
MSALRAWPSLLVGVAIVVSACGGSTPRPAGTTATPHASADLPPQWVHTTLTYSRLQIFSSVNRPAGFGFVRDYRTSTTVEDLTGAWNDASQTLTADVSVQVKSENLVYVDDPAVTPGGETPIRAGRAGQLHEVTCPQSVSLEHACYLLQLLR